MVTMKTDMSGAAAVLATLSTLPTIKPNVRVVGYLAASENLPGPSATKPGDVLTARNGKTMEVLNTDAEGRLVLADALSLAVEDDVDAIIDIATLTGACKMALGDDVAGLFGTDDALVEQVKASSLRTAENVWQLPLHERYAKLIESNVADIKNQATLGGGGLITSAFFLKEFVGDKPWVHLDIAGTARGDGDDALSVKGGTGWGVRLLVDVVRNFA
jgi:leucyl aminopeptidase